jgi:peroxiredoxin
MVVSMDERHIPAVSEQAPEFALADSTGVVRRLDELLARGIGVIVFYRGHW